jgi:phage terminase large subunit-like protein
MRGRPAENEPYPAEIQAILTMPYGLKGFRRFAKLLGLRIHPFQAFILALYFAGVVELVILISKKNGKTTLLAALALYHLLMTPTAECVIGASSRDQATILLNQCVKLVEYADLERRALPGDRHEPTRYRGVFEIRTGYRLIRFEQGRIRVLAADADTADGIIPTLALVDELHRHPSGALYGVFRDGLLEGAQMITISTAGSAMDSPLGELLSQARTFKTEQVKRRRTYTSADGSFVLVEWALEAEDDAHDMRLVKSVNPAPWHTIQTLRRRHDSPSMTPWQWLRFACGIWTEGDEPGIDPAIWDGLAQSWELTPNEDVWTAASVGNLGEESAIVIVARRGESLLAQARILPPDSPLEAVEDEVRDVANTYRVASVCFVPRQFARCAEMLEKEGLMMIEFPLSLERTSKASTTLWRLIERKELHHTGDKALRAHVLAGTVKEDEQGWRFTKSGRQVAGLYGLLMAVQTACDNPVREALMAWA